jgi:hypothetical protein
MATFTRRGHLRTSYLGNVHRVRDHTVSRDYGRPATPVREILHLSTALRVWRSFVNPNARCPVCKQLVYFYQSESGGRVFFDQLGPPWHKHHCTDRRTWRWPVDTEFMLKEEDVREPSTPPAWQLEGWVPVAKVEWTDGRRTSKIKLASVIVWSALDASKLKVLWSARQKFIWGGRVMMRQDPRSPHRVEFETFRLDGEAARVRRLVTVKNDPLTTVPTLLSRLHDKR